MKSQRGTFAGKDIQDANKQVVEAAVSPRAVEKRARPGNEDTPAPAGPPATLTPADFDRAEPAEVEADDDEVKDGATG